MTLLFTGNAPTRDSTVELNSRIINHNTTAEHTGTKVYNEQTPIMLQLSMDKPLMAWHSSHFIFVPSLCHKWLLMAHQKKKGRHHENISLEVILPQHRLDECQWPCRNQF